MAHLLITNWAPPDCLLVGGLSMSHQHVRQYSLQCGAYKVVSEQANTEWLSILYA